MLRTRARSGPKRQATGERALHMHAMMQREQCGNGTMPFVFGFIFGRQSKNREKHIFAQARWTSDGLHRSFMITLKWLASF